METLIKIETDGYGIVRVIDPSGDYEALVEVDEDDAITREHVIAAVRRVWQQLDGTL